MNETGHTRLRTLADPGHLPALKPDYVHRRPALGLGDSNPPPRILLLYGSLRERSYSRLVVEEAARLLGNGDADGARRIVRRVAPAAVRSVSRRVLSDARVQRLAEVGAAIEARFGARTQDIEWAIAGERVLVLQSRPFVCAPSP